MPRARSRQLDQQILPGIAGLRRRKIPRVREEIRTNDVMVMPGLPR
jgi:hypothetical protein